MTKEEVIAAILACKEKLGRVPLSAEVLKGRRVNTRALYTHFRTYASALKACGLTPIRGGRKATEPAALFEDWVRVTRRLERFPTAHEYETFGRYTQSPLARLAHRWSRVPAAVKRFAERNGLKDQWKDVIALVTKGQSERRKAQARILKDRPVYGGLIRRCAMLCKPTNEAGVMVLFGAEALRLGFSIVHVQTAYPDCTAWREVGKDRLQLVKIEFERASRNFLRHRHDPAKCDLIVCWEHNWPECPLEVIELRKLVDIR